MGAGRTARSSLDLAVAVCSIVFSSPVFLAASGEPGRERSNDACYGRLINGDRGGYIGYAMWRRYLKLAHGYTAAHPDGIIRYTAHELRHVCASLLIASGASDVQVAHQMGHSKIETTKNIYGHLFAQDRTAILARHEPGREPVARLRIGRQRQESGRLTAASPMDRRAGKWENVGSEVADLGGPART